MQGKTRFLETIRALSVLALIAAITGVILLKDHILGLRSMLDQLGWEAMVLFVIGYIILVTLLMPMTALNIIGGILFGPIHGLILNIIGGAVGAQTAFLTSRYLGRHTNLSTSLTKFPKIASLAEQLTFRRILLLRLMPIIPYNILNYVFGMSKAEPQEHFFATTIGIIPAVAIYTISAGIIGEVVLEQGLRALTLTQQILIGSTLGLLIILSTIPAYIQHKRKTL